MVPPPTPSLDVDQWFNSEPLTLDSLRGRVVLIEAFQMLCPACVTHSLPQAVRVRKLYPADEVAVIGIHTVFEHHDAMGLDALGVFLAEFRITFPVAVDRPDPISSIPATMRAYDLQGTPSQILLDRQGRVRSSTFGVVDDLALGTRIGRLLAEPTQTPISSDAAIGPSPDFRATGDEGPSACDADTGCR